MNTWQDVPPSWIGGANTTDIVPVVPDEESAAPSSTKTSSSYKDQSTNDLSLISGAALMCADCMGTGILALPADVKSLGTLVGIGFIALNLPINLYAGSILGRSARYVERTLYGGRAGDDDHSGEDPLHNAVADGGKEMGYSSVNNVENDPPKSVTTQFSSANDDIANRHEHYITNTATFDFIGMTCALFTCPSPSQPSHHLKYDHPATRLVLAMYYTNIFLVLGNYILVMSHSVAGMVGEDNICLPTAGLLASTLMFVTSQLRTMAKLGRSASAISLSALFIVVLQCLWATAQRSKSDIDGGYGDGSRGGGEEVSGSSLLQKMGALASIGFAVGSQKLFLNIRHEMKVRDEAAPGSLGIALSTFGSAYIIVCMMAGPNPPSFLFDAIKPGTGRRVAGCLLSIHVAVSFAINSQALCSSIDRIWFHRVTALGFRGRHRLRWTALTVLITCSSYLVSNAIPFFKDLVALIGALTSIPLTLLLPGIFHRRVMGVPIFCPTTSTILSFALVVFSAVFLLVGLIGAIGSIGWDWEHQSGPFACY